KDGAFYGTGEFEGPSLNFNEGTLFKLDFTPGWSFDTPFAASACGDGAVNVAVLSTVTNGTCPQFITRIWLGTDTCGNTNTCSQTITLTYVTPPTLTGGTNRTVNSASPWDFDFPSVSDGCHGTNAVITILSTVTNGQCPQVITRTW